MDEMTIPKLKPEVKEKWLAALRSGEYKQGYEYLHIKGKDQDTFCCLGVLCDLYVKTGGEIEIKGKGECHPHLESVGAVVYDGRSGALPTRVKNWAFDTAAEVHGMVSFRNPIGVRAENDRYDGWCSLGYLNDTKRYPFDKIADVIEEHL